MSRPTTIAILLFAILALFGCDDQQYRSDASVVENNGGASNADTIPCKALPICADDEIEHASDCDGCREVTKCGTTIYCEEDLSQCRGVPVCPDGTEEVAGPCPPDGSCMSVTECGTTIECRELPDTCDAVPTCPPADVPVSSCPAEQNPEAPCEAVTLCGSTVFCQSFPDACSARPSCDDNEITTTSECAAGETTCREVSACGVVLFCRPEFIDPFECTLLPNCGPDYTHTQDPCGDEADCFEASVCDRTVSCKPIPDFVCDDGPSCPQGYVSSHAPCAELEPLECTHDTVCGETLYCRQGATACASPPTCPDDRWLTQRRCWGSEGCSEHYRCNTFVSCRTDLEDCDGVPDCPEGTERSDLPCRDDEVGCRDGSACGLTLFCRTN